MFLIDKIITNVLQQMTTTLKIKNDKQYSKYNRIHKMCDI